MIPPGCAPPHAAKLITVVRLRRMDPVLPGREDSGRGAFIHFRFPRIHGVSLPDTVAFEHLQGTTFIESERDVNTYQVVFNALRDSSISPQASRDTLAKIGREVWNE